jgi:mono/diheme cytochrome c family protein
MCRDHLIGMFGGGGKRRFLAGAICALAVSGCGSSDPVGYQRADAVRGGQLFDIWWLVRGVADTTAPTQTNPAYATTRGTRTGSATWRCRECHGVDYRGKDGIYASGTHSTGAPGLLDAAQDKPEEVFSVVHDGVAGTAMVAQSAHLSDTDIWDLVKFIREGVVDLTPYIDATTSKSTGDAAAGKSLYDAECARCHGPDGKALNFRTAAMPEYVGTVAASDPWGLQHRVRFSVVGKKTPAGEEMPAFLHKHWTMNDVANVLAYAQTLPSQ